MSSIRSNIPLAQRLAWSPLPVLSEHDKLPTEDDNAHVAYLSSIEQHELSILAAKLVRETDHSAVAEMNKGLSDAGYTIHNTNNKAPWNGQQFCSHKSGWKTMTNEEIRDMTSFEANAEMAILLEKQENGERMMSLDFDVCGENNYAGKLKQDLPQFRVGCPIAARLLAEYVDGIDSLDGMFSSSTRGNYNVLINYTNSPKICSLVDAPGAGAEFAIGGMEVFWKRTQMLPPSRTTDKISGEMGKRRTYLSDEPIYKIEDDDTFMVRFIEKLFDNRESAKPARIIKKHAPKEMGQEGRSDMWTELLFDVIKNGDRNAVKLSWADWFQIRGIMASNNYTFDEFAKFSAPQDDEASSAKMWDSGRMPGATPSMTLHGLQNIANKVNRPAYEAWLQKHKKGISISILEKGENDIAKFISSKLRETLVFCGNWWILNEHGLWTESKKAPLGKIITHVQDLIQISQKIAMEQCDQVFSTALNTPKTDASKVLFKTTVSTTSSKYAKLKTEPITPEIKKQLEAAEAPLGALESHYKAIGKSTMSMHLARILEEELLDSEFARKLNRSPYTIAYQNGILDLKTMDFREGVLGTDMLSKTIPHNYEVALDADVAYVREEIKKICNYNDEMTEYYLGALGYAMTGDSRALHELYFLAGQSASNGKSVLLEIISTLCPNYVGTTDMCAFDAENTKAHKEIATWDSKRIVWADELSPAKKNSELLKKTTEGAPVKYDQLYGTNQTMDIQFKLFLVSNHSLNIKQDNGISRRYRHLQMDSKFKTKSEGWVKDDYEKHIFLKDEYFQSKITTKYRAAFLHLIFSHSNKFYVNKCLPEVPAAWAQEKASLEEQNDKFLEWFDATFTRDPALSVPKELMEQLKPSTLKCNIRDEFKRCGIKFEYESQRRKTIRSVAYKGFYMGFGIIERHDEDDDETREVKKFCHEMLHGSPVVSAPAIPAPAIPAPAIPAPAIPAPAIPAPAVSIVEPPEQTDAELLAEVLAEQAAFAKLRKEKSAAYAALNPKITKLPIKAVERVKYVKEYDPDEFDPEETDPEASYKTPEENAKNLQDRIDRGKKFTARSTACIPADFDPDDKHRSPEEIERRLDAWNAKHHL